MKVESNLNKWNTYMLKVHTDLYFVRQYNLFKYCAVTPHQFKRHWEKHICSCKWEAIPQRIRSFIKTFPFFICLPACLFFCNFKGWCWGIVATYSSRLCIYIFFLEKTDLRLLYLTTHIVLLNFTNRLIEQGEWTNKQKNE